MEYVSGGAGLFLFGNNDEGEVIVQNRMVWEFGGGCGEGMPRMEGESLGWIGFVSTCFTVLE